MKTSRHNFTSKTSRFFFRRLTAAGTPYVFFLFQKSTFVLKEKQYRFFSFVLLTFNTFESRDVFGTLMFFFRDVLAS